jgi:single-strand DNA-binding protein
MSLNRIVLQGRLTKDPELRTTKSGESVASFTLAVDRYDKEVDFIPITAWKNRAEFASKYLSKGRMALVEGRLQIRKWEDKKGNRRESAEVVADNIYFGDTKRDAPTPSVYDDNDEDCPF